MGLQLGLALRSPVCGVVVAGHAVGRGNTVVLEYVRET